MANKNTEKQNIPADPQEDAQDRDDSPTAQQELEPEQPERVSPATLNPKIKNV